MSTPVPYGITHLSNLPRDGRCGAREPGPRTGPRAKLQLQVQLSSGGRRQRALKETSPALGHVGSARDRGQTRIPTASMLPRISIIWSQKGPNQNPPPRPRPGSQPSRPTPIGLSCRRYGASGDSSRQLQDPGPRQHSTQRQERLKTLPRTHKERDVAARIRPRRRASAWGASWSRQNPGHGLCCAVAVVAYRGMRQRRLLYLGTT
ncbi:hypothetical protein DAEQUDRAFT_334790 [Daedalea quercina L-15889]|uniref:Uncharacterized protein n=1 Tax=Daedalea quercina L-15889 TaxID=1314783 RepID=A0A165PNF2_9APHY|nr:hypothetical protein DAEQUDRAFT_334790 [Daedalea quercina L-15889]